jgi:hypothetical protein
MNKLWKKLKKEQLEEMKLKRSRLYKKLKNYPENPEYQFNFFNYKPSEDFNMVTRNINKTYRHRQNRNRPHNNPKTVLTEVVKTFKERPFVDKRGKSRRNRNKEKTRARNYLSEFKQRKTRKQKY